MNEAKIFLLLNRNVIITHRHIVFCTIFPFLEHTMNVRMKKKSNDSIIHAFAIVRFYSSLGRRALYKHIPDLSDQYFPLKKKCF